jgi:23S rRNA (adenine2030-N6)-methyltransferase
MNYRHAYHAGNFADVFKHAGLALIVDYLKKKPVPFAVIDTHAGLGRYDLSAPEAEKTGEWRQGIGRVLESPPDLPGLGLLLKAVAAVNGGHKPSAAHMPRYYPGSPRVARTLLRKSDKLWCAELHPEDARALAREFRGDGQVEIRRMDGYEAIRAWLPPREKRGVVLIDPPFEQRDEFDHLLRGLKDGHRRFATGIFVLWYPIKARAPADRFHAALAESAIRRILAAELLIHRLDNSERLNGCGLIVVNPPWRLDADLARLTAGLAGLFAPDEGASSVGWLAGE